MDRWGWSSSNKFRIVLCPNSPRNGQRTCKFKLNLERMGERGGILPAHDDDGGEDSIQILNSKSKQEWLSSTYVVHYPTAATTQLYNLNS